MRLVYVGLSSMTYLTEKGRLKLSHKRALCRIDGGNKEGRKEAKGEVRREIELGGE